MKNSIIIIDHLQNDQQFTVTDNENKTFVIFPEIRDDISGDVNIEINGSGANVQILGIIIGSSKQKISLSTTQNHIKPSSISDLFIKSVLFDESKLNYKGLIKIGKTAQKSNAYQKNQNLLIGERTWADTRPFLEILANDVRCTHGATIGKLDEEQIYYLQTRGLKREIASKMLIVGFLKDVTEKIEDQKIRKELDKRIDSQIRNLI